MIKFNKDILIEILKYSNISDLFSSNISHSMNIISHNQVVILTLDFIESKENMRMFIENIEESKENMNLFITEIPHNKLIELVYILYSNSFYTGDIHDLINIIYENKLITNDGICNVIRKLTRKNLGSIWKKIYKNMKDE
jgi:hypothetical protein